jgi:hypothetical protein
MSTRAQVRFATREDGVSFSEHPEKINTQFYVHSDGYPEGLGVDIAESIIGGDKVAMEIENVDIKHGDLEYIYYVWQCPDKDMWISIFEVGWEDDEVCPTCGRGEVGFDWKPIDKCIFVGLPSQLINKYKQNTNDDG